MSTINLNLKNALVALGLAVSASAWATPLSLTGISGDYIVWDGNPTLLPAFNAGLTQAAAALGGDYATPGGNVELSKFGGAITTLTGTGSGHTITLSSLVLSDWTANGDALARRYIQDAASAAFGVPLSAADLTTALSNFFGLSIGLYKPWQLVSDPNISYVGLSSRSVSVGLAGLLDATAFLTGISGIPLTGPQQVSEVVKLSFDGSDPIYLYGFEAGPSGVSTSPNGDPTESYTGIYDVSFVPEPAGIALFGVALFGLALARRRT